MSWLEENNALKKTFRFSDFKSALTFINKVGEIAEAQQHHPDISLRDYCIVEISTTTHDDGYVITAKDYKLSQTIDQLSC
jgi:4a-hydroxytetrahydrobiopterin dehydratase